MWAGGRCLACYSGRQLQGRGPHTFSFACVFLHSCTLRIHSTVLMFLRTMMFCVAAGSFPLLSVATGVHIVGQSLWSVCKARFQTLNIFVAFCRQTFFVNSSMEKGRNPMQFKLTWSCRQWTEGRSEVVEEVLSRASCPGPAGGLGSPAALGGRRVPRLIGAVPGLASVLVCK